MRLPNSRRSVQLRALLVVVTAAVALCLAVPVAGAATPQTSLGNALDLNADSYALIPYSSAVALSGSSNFTIEAWANQSSPRAQDRWQTLYRQEAFGGEFQTWVFIDTAGKVHCWFGRQSIAWDQAAVTADAIPLDRWVHIAVVKSGSTVQIYVDGVPSYSGTIGAQPLAAAKSSRPSAIGGDYLEGNYFDGALDEVRVWGSPLTGATLNDWRFRGADPSHPAWSTMLVYYALNESSGTALSDSRGVAGSANLSAGGGSWIPSGVGLFHTTNEDVAFSGRLPHYDTDGGALTLSVASQPGHGTVSVTDPASGTYTYTPNPNYDGADSFRFTVSDGSSTSAQSTVSITVLPDADLTDYAPPTTPVRTPASSPWAIILMALIGTGLIAARRGMASGSRH